MTDIEYVVKKLELFKNKFGKHALYLFVGIYLKVGNEWEADAVEWSLV